MLACTIELLRTDGGKEMFEDRIATRNVCGFAALGATYTSI